MKIRRILSSLLVPALGFAFCLALGASAGSRAEETEPWSVELGELIQGPKACTASARKLEHELFYYEGIASHPNVFSLTKRAGAIQEILDASGDCYPALGAYYALKSVALLGKQMTASGVGLLRTVRLLEDQRPEARSVFRVAKLLYDQGRLVPLSDSLRRSWGGAWAASAGKILGAYQCEAGVVYVDPRQKPYDLAAVVVHELDHLTRDKFAAEERPEVFVRDVPLALLLDETLASLHAGYAQLSFRADSNREGLDEVGKPTAVGWLFQHRGNYFNIGSDLALYDRRGNLNRLWRTEIERSGLPKGELFSPFLDRAVLDGLENPVATEPREYFLAILGIVSDGYFAHAGPSAEDGLRELAAWRRADAELISPIGGRQERDPARFRRELEDRLARPTAGCRKISDAIRAGEAATYIGAQLGGALPKGGEGSRTGDGDVRTHGGEGSRTDDATLRLYGGEGTRTGGDIRLSRPLTPCLKPDERI